jgi:hypothetical protein
MQSRQLPTESQVFEDEVLAGTESADHPAEEMSKRGDHGKNLIGTVRIQNCAKSFILQVYDVLARQRVRWRCLQTALDVGVLSASFSVTSSHTIHPEAELKNLFVFAQSHGAFIFDAVRSVCCDQRPFRSPSERFSHSV